MISGPETSGDRDLFDLKANHPASLVTKAPAGWKGEKDVCFPVGIFPLLSMPNSVAVAALSLPYSVLQKKGDVQTDSER